MIDLSGFASERGGARHMADDDEAIMSRALPTLNPPVGRTVRGSPLGLSLLAITAMLAVACGGGPSASDAGTTPEIRTTPDTTTTAEVQAANEVAWCSNPENHAQIYNSAVALNLPISPLVSAQLNDEGIVEYSLPEHIVELRLSEVELRQSGQFRPYLAQEDFNIGCHEAWLERESGIYRGDLVAAPSPELPEVQAPPITDPGLLAYIEFAAEKFAGTTFEDTPSWGLINMAKESCEQLDEGVLVDEAALSLMNVAMLDATSTEEGTIAVLVVLIAGVDSTCPWHSDSVAEWLSHLE